MSLKRTSSVMLSIVFILRPPRLAHSQIRFSFQCPSTGTRFTVVQIPRTRSRVMLLTNLSQSSQLPKGECKQCKNAGYIGQPIWWDTAKPNSGSIYCISELGSSTIFPRSLISTKLHLLCYDNAKSWVGGYSDQIFLTTNAPIQLLY